jgi:hypothetical protein
VQEAEDDTNDTNMTSNQGKQTCVPLAARPRGADALPTPRSGSGGGGGGGGGKTIRRELESVLDDVVDPLTRFITLEWAKDTYKEPVRTHSARPCA